MAVFSAAPVLVDSAVSLPAAVPEAAFAAGAAVLLPAPVAFAAICGFADRLDVVPPSGFAVGILLAVSAVSDPVTGADAGNCAACSAAEVSAFGAGTMVASTTDPGTPSVLPSVLIPDVIPVPAGGASATATRLVSSLAGDGASCPAAGAPPLGAVAATLGSGAGSVLGAAGLGVALAETAGCGVSVGAAAGVSAGDGAAFAAVSTFFDISGAVEDAADGLTSATVVSPEASEALATAEPSVAGCGVAGGVFAAG